jgi:hypothetical protein
MAFLDEQRRPEKTRGSYARSRVSTTDATRSERACLLGSTAATQLDSGREGFDAAAEPSRVDGDECDQTIEDLQNTCKAYVDCARAFVAYHRRPPERMGELEIRQFLIFLVETKKVGRRGRCTSR